MKPPRFQLKLAVALGCLVIGIEAAVLLSLGNFYLRHFGDEVNRRLNESLAQPGALVAQGALSADAFGQRQTLESVVGPALDDAMIVSAEGVILVALEPERVGRRWQEYPSKAAGWLQRAATGAFNERVQVGAESYLVRVAPVASPGREAPVLFTYVRIRTTDNTRELADLRLRLIGGLAGAIIVTTAALLLAVHLLVTRRIRRIAAAVRQVTEGNYAAELGPGRWHDEIGFLQTGFDTMTGRLREAFTGLQRAVGDLEVAEQKYRVLVENADLSIVVVQDGKLAFANAMSHQMLVRSGESIVGRPILDFVHPADRAMIQERYQQRVRGEGVVPRYEFRMIASAGQTIWVELNAVLIEWKGRPATLNFLRDSTQRKQAEQEREKLQAQLTQSQKMESIGRLAGGVAHDFNNMLQAILGNVALARAALPPGGEAQEGLDEIETSARRSADLTRQLLAFARKQTVAPRLLDFNVVIADMLKLLQRLIGENIQLVWMPGAGLWPVTLDPTQLDQILANLGVNARDAIDGPGRITIETRNVTLDDTYLATNPECRPGDYVMLTVSDTGCGMDGATRAHIFEPFFTTKAEGMGTGLGLATVFGIVQQNQGLINVYSEPGQGTTFKLYFPRGAGSLEAEAVPVPPVVGGDETLLLVEDEEQVLRLSLKILRQRGYTVLSASTPSAALELAEVHAGPIHLLITDVVMPGMNGKELRDRLLSGRGNLRCLFMSGYTADIIAHHGVLEGGVEFLQKPFMLPELLAKVRQVLDAG